MLVGTDRRVLMSVRGFGKEFRPTALAALTASTALAALAALAAPTALAALAALAASTALAVGIPTIIVAPNKW